MEIRVFSTFWNPLKQDKFIVEAKEDIHPRRYHGVYEAGAWDFRLYDQARLFLESRRIPLSRKKTFFGYREYRVFWKEKEIGGLERTYLKKKIWTKNAAYPFPGFFHPTIPALQLTFPVSALLWRRKIRSYCTAEDPQMQMFSIAVAIYFWFTWNALPAD